MRIHSTLLAALMTTALAACSGAETTAPSTQVVEAEENIVTLAEVLAHPRREAEAKRDKFRNPAATLEFFEIAPGKRFGEIWPGWYTNATAPYLAANGGQYVAVLYPESVGERYAERVQKYKEKYSDSSVYGEIEYAAFWKDSGPILAEGQAPLDVLVTYWRNKPVLNLLRPARLMRIQKTRQITPLVFGLCRRALACQKKDRLRRLILMPRPLRTLGSLIVRL